MQLLTTAHRNRPNNLLKVTLGSSEAAGIDPNAELQGVPPKPRPPSCCPSRCPHRPSSTFTHLFGEQMAERMFSKPDTLKRAFFWILRASPRSQSRSISLTSFWKPFLPTKSFREGRRQDTHKNNTEVIRAQQKRAERNCTALDKREQLLRDQSVPWCSPAVMRSWTG